MHVLDQSSRYAGRVIVDPVTRIEVPQDRSIAQPPGIQARRRIVLPKRRAKQALAVGRERARTGAQLPALVPPRNHRELWMVPRVIADGMPGLGYLPHQSWIVLGPLPQHEEGGLD